MQPLIFGCIFVLQDLMMFQYRAFGLNIQSGVEYPEFYPILFSGDPDVFLEHIEMRQGLEEVIGNSRSNEKQDKYFFYSVKDVAAYEVSEGKMINVFMPPSAEPEAVRLYCLSNAFAALLYQRKSIPLHAAAMLINDNLALFLGDSGAGKSTLMLYLKSKGYKVFSDDVCVPFNDFGARQVRVHASYPMMKCWSSTIDMLKLGDQSFHSLKRGMDKFGLYFHDFFELQPKAPQFIFFLEKSEEAGGVSFSMINGVEVFSRLIAQAYRSHHIMSKQHKQPIFDIFSQLSQQAKAFVIRRPPEIESYELIAQKVMQQIMQ